MCAAVCVLFLHCFISVRDICCIMAVSVVGNAGQEEEREGGGAGFVCRLLINLKQVVFLLESSNVSGILTVAVMFC